MIMYAGNAWCTSNPLTPLICVWKRDMEKFMTILVGEALALIMHQSFGAGICRAHLVGWRRQGRH